MKWGIGIGIALAALTILRSAFAGGESGYESYGLTRSLLILLYPLGGLIAGVIYGVGRPLAETRVRKGILGVTCLLPFSLVVVGIAGTTAGDLDWTYWAGGVLNALVVGGVGGYWFLE